MTGEMIRFIITAVFLGIGVISLFISLFRNISLSLCAEPHTLRRDFRYVLYVLHTRRPRRGERA